MSGRFFSQLFREFFHYTKNHYNLPKKPFIFILVLGFLHFLYLICEFIDHKQNRSFDSKPYSNNFNSLTDSIDAKDKYRESLPVYKRIIYDTPRAYAIVLPRMWKSIIYCVKMQFQRIFRGYSAEEVFEYYSLTSERAVKLLTKIKESKQGIPMFCFDDVETSDSLSQEENYISTRNAAKKWDDVLSDMIFYHKLLSEEQVFEDDLKQNNPDDYHRYKRGRYYYMKYYQSLWT